MFRDGLWHIVTYEWLRPTKRGEIKVCVWFSYDAKPRFRSYGSGPSFPEAVEDAVTRFGQRGVGPQESIKLALSEVEVFDRKAKERQKRMEARGRLTSRYSPGKRLPG